MKFNQKIDFNGIMVNKCWNKDNVISMIYVSCQMKSMNYNEILNKFDVFHNNKNVIKKL